jgi:hypothetical protein
MALNAEFHFQAKAQSAFDFLAQEFGYACVLASHRELRYESAKVYLRILHSPRDYELSITFGRLNKDERFYFSMFLDLVNPELRKTFGYGIADTPDAVAAAVKSLAAALRSDGMGIITGDDALFDRMKDVRWWHFHPEMLVDPNDAGGELH